MHMIIEDYQRLSSITEQMRDAAAASEWDKLVELEQRCTQEVAAIKPHDVVPTDEVYASRKQTSSVRCWQMTKRYAPTLNLGCASWNASCKAHAANNAYRMLI